MTSLSLYYVGRIAPEGQFHKVKSKDHWEASDFNKGSLKPAGPAGSAFPQVRHKLDKEVVAYCLNIAGKTPKSIDTKELQLLVTEVNSDVNTANYASKAANVGNSPQFAQDNQVNERNISDRSCVRAVINSYEKGEKVILSAHEAAHLSDSFEALQKMCERNRNSTLFKALMAAFALLTSEVYGDENSVYHRGKVIHKSTAKGYMDKELYQKIKSGEIRNLKSTDPPVQPKILKGGPREDGGKAVAELTKKIIVVTLPDRKLDSASMKNRVVIGRPSSAGPSRPLVESTTPRPSTPPAPKPGTHGSAAQTANTINLDQSGSEKRPAIVITLPKASQQRSSPFSPISINPGMSPSILNYSPIMQTPSPFGTSRSSSPSIGFVSGIGSSSARSLSFSSPSPASGGHFYKGGQFTPGGGRAPKGGVWM